MADASSTPPASGPEFPASGPDPSAPSPESPVTGHEPPVTAAPARGFSAFLVGRPVTVLMLFLTLVGTGLMAYLRMPLTLLPRGLSSSSLSISLPYPGAGPQEVHDQLTRVVEDELRTIPGISEIFSVSSEGFADITVSFGTDTDIDIAYGEVRDRVERVRPMLPPEMDRYRIRRWNSNTDMPVLFMGVQYDAEAEDPFGPIERIIVPRLEAVDGVAQVGTMGVVDQVVRIFVDIEKVRGYGIDLGSVIRKLQQDNFTLPAGQIDDGGRSFSLRIDARFHSVHELNEYPIGGGRVLADIADVVLGRAYRDSVWRINGREAVGMQVSRESDENTIEVCTRAEEAVAALQEDPRLEGIKMNVFFSQKEAILNSIESVQSSALWGGLFAIIVLYFFLRDLRMTLIAALAIPSSLLTALMVTYFGGQTLNIISMVGFTLAIGMLVDNAVVVIENIARKRAAGHSRSEAAARGAAEVGLAVLTATLTSVVVFLPLVFMDGGRNVRIMLAEIGLPISYSLGASLLVAMVFIPAFASRLMRDRAHKIDSREISGGLVRSYRSALSWVLHHRLAAVLLLVVVVRLAGMAGEQVPQSNSEGGDDDAVSMIVDLPNNFTLSDANDVFRKLEEFAEEHEQQVGYDFYSSRFSRRSGEMDFYAREDLDQELRETMADNLRGLVNSELVAPGRLPGVELTIGWEAANATDDLRVVLTGPDFGVLAELAEGLKPRLAALTTAQDGEPVPLFENVRSDIDRGLDEVHILIDRERSSELQIAPESVRGIVAWGLGGQRLPDFEIGEREIPARIEYGQTEEESLNFLRNISVWRDTGDSVPLASVADFEFDKSVGALVRRNNRTSMAVTAKPVVQNIALVSAEVADMMTNFPLPEGYSWAEEGGSLELEEDLSALFNTLGFSVLLVYLLMSILLESAVLPLSILLSIPLALMGVQVTLFLTNSRMNAMVAIGMILLAGIVVNNAIVLLDRVQRLRAEGRSRDDSLLTGGAERMRPILMTALTTIFGLLPMAVPGWFPGSNGNSGYESLAITVAGGLAFSTFFTLLIVPLFYTFFDDVGQVFTRLLPRRATDEDEGPTEPAPPEGGARPVPVMDRHND